MALSVEAGALLGISRDLAYDLVASRQLPSVRLDASELRREWDLNPRGACTPKAFQEPRIRPLCHPSNEQHDPTETLL